jgi:outer membrane protein
MKAGMASWAVAAGLLVVSQSGLAGLAELASAAEPFKVGVIQQRTIIEQTKAGKRAMDSLKEFQGSRQRIIATDDQELKKLEDELKAKESVLSESAKLKKQEEFRGKFENYQRRIQNFDREIQQKQKEVAVEFQKKIDEAVQAVAEKGGFTAVIDEGGAATIQVVLYAHASVNLTDQVVKEFDRRNK